MRRHFGPKRGGLKFYAGLRCPPARPQRKEGAGRVATTSGEGGTSSSIDSSAEVLEKLFYLPMLVI